MFRKATAEARKTGRSWEEGAWGRGGAEEEEGERLRDSFLPQKPRWLVSYYLQEGDISNSGEKEINTAATRSIQNSETIINVI